MIETNRIVLKLANNNIKLAFEMLHPYKKIVLHPGNITPDQFIHSDYICMIKDAKLQIIPWNRVETHTVYPIKSIRDIDGAFKWLKDQNIATPEFATPNNNADVMAKIKLLIQSLPDRLYKKGFTGSPHSPANAIYSQLAWLCVDFSKNNAQEQFWKILYPEIKTAHCNSWPVYGHAILSKSETGKLLNEIIDYENIYKHATIQKIDPQTGEAVNFQTLKASLTNNTMKRIYSFYPGHTDFWTECQNTGLTPSACNDYLAFFKKLQQFIKDNRAGVDHPINGRSTELEITPLAQTEFSNDYRPTLARFQNYFKSLDANKQKNIKRLTTVGMHDVMYIVDTLLSPNQNSNNTDSCFNRLQESLKSIVSDTHGAAAFLQGILITPEITIDQILNQSGFDQLPAPPSQGLKIAATNKNELLELINNDYSDDEAPAMEYWIKEYKRVLGDSATNMKTLFDFVYWIEDSEKKKAFLTLLLGNPMKFTLHATDTLSEYLSFTQKITDLHLDLKLTHVINDESVLHAIKLSYGEGNRFLPICDLMKIFERYPAACLNEIIPMLCLNASSTRTQNTRNSSTTREQKKALFLLIPKLFNPTRSIDQLRAFITYYNDDMVDDSLRDEHVVRNFIDIGHYLFDNTLRRQFYLCVEPIYFQNMRSLDQLLHFIDIITPEEQTWLEYAAGYEAPDIPSAAQYLIKHFFDKPIGMPTKLVSDILKLHEMNFIAEPEDEELKNAVLKILSKPLTQSTSTFTKEHFVIARDLLSNKAERALLFKYYLDTIGETLFASELQKIMSDELFDIITKNAKENYGAQFTRDIFYILNTDDTKYIATLFPKKNVNYLEILLSLPMTVGDLPNKVFSVFILLTPQQKINFKQRVFDMIENHITDLASNNTLNVLLAEFSDHKPYIEEKIIYYYASASVLFPFRNVDILLLTDSEKTHYKQKAFDLFIKDFDFFYNYYYLDEFMDYLSSKYVTCLKIHSLLLTEFSIFESASVKTSIKREITGLYFRNQIMDDIRAFSASLAQNPTLRTAWELSLEKDNEKLITNVYKACVARKPCSKSSSTGCTVYFSSAPQSWTYSKERDKPTDGTRLARIVNALQN